MMRKLIHGLLYRFCPRLWFAVKYRVENEYQNYAYSRREIVPYGDTLRKYMAIAPVFGDLVRNRTLLEIGCDTGFFPLLAGLMGAARAVGVDRNERALKMAEMARVRLDLSHVEFRHGAVPDIGVEGPFDTVLLMSAIHYLFSDKCGNKQLFSTMDELVEYILPMVGRSLVIEFVQPEDTMAKALVVDGLIGSEEYSTASLLAALQGRALTVRDLGATHRETRRLYLAERRR